MSDQEKNQEKNQKRKYVRKSKKEEIVEEETVEEPIEYKSFVVYNNNPKVYFYYEGHDIDTLKYIKKLQSITENFRIKTQVVICARSRFEHSVKLNNCFYTDQYKEDFTWLSLSKESFCAVKIKERPRYPEIECFEKMKEGNFEDGFILVKDVHLN